MDKLKTKILLISLLLIMLLSLQGAAAASDDGNLISENIDLSICDNEDYVGSDSLLAAANSEDVLGEGEGNFTELQNLINAHYGRDLTLNKSYICNGEGQINIKGPITIHGNGNTLNGNIQARIFNVNASDVVIQDIVFTNGADTTGGAVYWTGENGKLTNCNFTNNTADYGNGGAVYWEGENGKLTNCNFTNNTASLGGAIRWTGENGNLTNCNFTNNTASLGAIYWTGENGKLTNCNFTNNKATTGAGGAVAWYIDNGKLTNCNFTNNTAEYGGAIWWAGYSSNLTNCTFTNNHATDEGGAIYWVGDDSTLTNCTFTDNTANLGGAICCWSDNTNVSNCNFTNNIANQGGAVYWSGEDGYGKNGKLTKCTFTNNKATNGGGAIQWNGESGTLSNCNFTNNHANDNDGGAVYWGSEFVNSAYRGDNGELTNCNFNNNNAYDGGAVYWKDNNGTLTNCNFTTNNANQNGGAIYWASDNGTLSNCNFTNNTADKNGGAAYWNGDNGNLTNCNFTNNNATQHGGAVYWYGEGNYGKNGKLTNCNFTNNHANTNGGAVNWKGYKGNLTNSNFTNNHANTNGGAVEWLGGYGNLANSNFTNNTASNGGAVIWSVSCGNLTNSNFTNNHANSNGGAVYWNGMSGNLANSNFTNNTASNGGAVYWVGKLGNLANSNFTNNAAIYGGALSCSDENSDVSSSVFLNNKAISRNLTANNGKDSLTLTFRGGENYINAIYGLVNALVDVTYWDGKITTGTPHARSDYEAGQNITIEVYDYVKNLLDNVTLVTDLNGEVKYDYTHLFDGNYTYVAYHPDDAYYTYINATGNFTLNRNKTNITISVNNASYGEYPVANITTDVAGTYTIIIANKTYDPVVFTQQDVDNHRVKQVAVDELLDPKEGYVASVHFKGTEFYSTETRETQFNIGKGSSTITITDYTSPINIGDNATVAFEINPNVTDNAVTLWINTKEILTYDFEFNTGSFLITKDKFPSIGTYNITMQYLGNGYYNASNIASCIIAVNKINVTMNAEGSTVYYGENATITVTGLPDDATGNVSVRVGDGIFFADIENGEATIEIPDLLADKYEELIVKYSGDTKYNNASAEATVIVKPASSKIVIDPIDNVTYGEDVIVTYSAENETNLNITVTDANGKTITEGIDASAKGKVVISGLDAGEYTIKISNAEEGNYLGSDDEATFTVLKAGSTISAKNKTFTYPEDVILVANGENCTGINETTVVVRDLNGIVKANVKVDGYRITIKGLGAGNYTVYYNNTVDNNWNSAGNKTCIYILKANSSVSASDVEVSYGETIVIVVESDNATEVSYQIIGQNGLVKEGTIGIGENITDLDLSAGDYTVNLTTIVNSNYTAANNTSKVTVKTANSTVSAPDVEVSYGETITVPVSVVNASEYYYAIVDEEGVTVDSDIIQVGLNITVENLSAGNYNITLITGVDANHTSVTNASRITVKRAKSSVSAEDVNASYGEAISIAVTSVNATEVSYKIIDNTNNVVANGTVEPNGTISISDLAAGDYTVNLTAVTDENHTGASSTSKLHIKHVVSIIIDSISGYADEVVNFTAEFKYENGEPVNEGDVTLIIRYDEKLAASLSSLLGADDTYSSQVSGGKATFNIKLGDPGTYPYTVTYSSEDTDTVEAESTVQISKLETTVSGENITGKPADEKSITIDVLDQNNDSVANGTATLTLNGETYNATVENGKAVFSVELPSPGTYEATIKYNGNDYYEPSESTINVDVEKVNTKAPSAEDISGKAGEKTDITIEIVDENGNPVHNGTATLTIDGKTYTAEVQNGTATFKDVVLPEKDTVADVYYQGNEYYNSSSTTFSIKIEPENNNTDENQTINVPSKAIDTKATGNPIAMLVMVLTALVITYRRKN